MTFARQSSTGYYSTNESDPDVYHKYSDCPVGIQIPIRNKQSGTNGNRLCERCRDKK